MFKKIIGAAMVSLVAVQSFAFEVECRNADEAARAKSHGFTCAAPKDTSKPSAITLMRQKLQCKIEMKNLGCREMAPLDDSGCVIGKEELQSGRYEGMKQTNYVAYYNQRVKLVTVIEAGSCQVNQIYFAGKLSKFEVFDNKLFALVNGKPMLLDNKAKLQELLSKNGNSYNDGNASITDIQASVDGSTLNLTRDLSKKTDTTQLIKVEAADIKGDRVKAVQASEFVHAYVKEIDDYADVVK